MELQESYVHRYCMKDKNKTQIQDRKHKTWKDKQVLGCLTKKLYERKRKSKQADHFEEPFDGQNVRENN